MLWGPGIKTLGDPRRGRLEAHILGVFLWSSEGGIRYAFLPYGPDLNMVGFRVLKME